MLLQFVLSTKLLFEFTRNDAHDAEHLRKVLLCVPCPVSCCRPFCPGCALCSLYLILSNKWLRLSRKSLNNLQNFYGTQVKIVLRFLDFGFFTCVRISGPKSHSYECPPPLPFPHPRLGSPLCLASRVHVRGQLFCVTCHLIYLLLVYA